MCKPTPSMATRSCLVLLTQSLCLVIFALSNAPTVLAATNPDIQIALHKITYAGHFKGIPVGRVTLQLTYDGQSHLYHYETVADPVWLARVVVSTSTHENSVFSLTPEGVRAAEYTLADASQPKRGTFYHYDWEHLKVTGSHESVPLSLSITSPTYDPLSIRAQLLFDFARGKASMTYSMLDGDELKHFVYTQKNLETLSTAIGMVKAVAWESQKENANPNDRSWRYWLAPEFGYLPVVIEQRQDGKSRLRFSVLSLEWTDPKTQKVQVLGSVTPR
jgi:Protein of unknown function (DUF3108)